MIAGVVMAVATTAPVATAGPWVPGRSVRLTDTTTTRGRAGHRNLPWVPDSARPTGPLARFHSTPWRVAAAVGPPVVLIGIGLISRQRAMAGMFFSRGEVHEEIQERYAGFHTRLDDYSRHVPTAAVFGLSLAGVPARHALPDRLLLFAAANLVGTGATSWLKHQVRDSRPYDPANHSSFPSYHTTQAFIGATVLAEEYGGRRGGAWIAAGGYAVATATGVLRLLNNRHWSSDVLAGAGIGILSTEVVYAVYPVVRRVVLGGRDRPLRSLVLPTLPTRGSRLGVAAVWLLR
ncbi:MAG: phosphatase PAP2 family protein [Hymenobacteraceae bacterium]|nr:phosphatase PAP2 family protein [Hymenobacteraceae bacterium]